jgi:type IV pilus assembly protein PilP
VRNLYLLLALSIPFALAACGGDETPVVQTGATAAVDPATGAAVDPAAGTPTPAATPEESAAEEYNYNPIGKRDPFRSFLADELAPDTRKVVTPLQRFDLDQLHIIGIIWGISSPRAMITTPEGKGYVVQKGTLIGKNWGKVSRITQDEVIISEEYRDFEGKLIVTEVPLKLPKDEAQDLE